MEIYFSLNGKTFRSDINSPMLISIPVVFNEQGPNCFYAPWPEATAVRSGDFIGSIEEGGLLNFKNIRLNPHGNGTHTECQSHIYPGTLTISDCLQQNLFSSRLISVFPTLLENGDKCILAESLFLPEKADTDALIIRTLPNENDKLQRNYSGSNPPYLSQAAAQAIAECGYQHLLIDLPSVDRENDGGAFSAHKAFWSEKNILPSKKTISELIFVPNEIKDGVYLLSIQIAHLQLDASPSRIALYNMIEEFSI
jgi:arylformamidase